MERWFYQSNINRLLLAGTYTVTGTDANGCSASDSMVIDVLTVDITQNDTTICEGDSLVLDMNINGITQSVNDPTNLAIGDTYQGGIVFYLDGNGGGLVAALLNRFETM